MADFATAAPPPHAAGAGAPGPGPGGAAAAFKKPDAFADAVQRARQIAAKIGGDTANTPTTTNHSAPEFGFVGQKRQLEDGDQPDSKKIASQNDPIGAQLGSMHHQPRAEEHRPRNMVTVTEEYRVPDGMVGLIIGRGGEQINRIQQESGCKVQIAPDSGGMPERIVSLTGNPEAIQTAKMLLDEIVSRGRGGPPGGGGGSVGGPPHDATNGQNGSIQEIMIPAGKAGLVIGKGGETIKQLQERAGVKMILIQDGSQNSNVDKPLRIIGDPFKVQQARDMVMEILHEREQGGFGDRNEFNPRPGNPGVGAGIGGIDIPVPRHSVGIVIGRSGEMIKKIQNDAGVRIQFKPDDGTTPDKIAHVMGPPERCQHAAQIISDLLQNVRGGPPGPPGPGMPGPGRGRGRGQGTWGIGPPGGEMAFSVPSHKCGLVIGRGGENVKAINQQTGAFVELQRQPPPNGDPNFKLFTIRGSPQQIDHAKQLIEEKIEGPLCPIGPPIPGGPMGPFQPGPFPQGPPGAPPPHPVAGGPPPPHQYPPQGWGNTYQQWQPPGGPHDPSKAPGDPNAAAWAAYYQQYYQQPGPPVPAPQPGPAPGPPGPAEPAPQPQAPGQPDYTKAWEEYYKKLGQQNPPGQQPGPQQDYTKAWEEYYKKQAQSAQGAAAAVAAAPQPGGAQPDYSAAWAEYYRQQAAYYGQPAGPQPTPQQPPVQLGQPTQ
ncbi:far upstream element-binding protein 2 isoform X2 [Callorhinchus milii]|uniref:Far upstream element-binding protein 2 n=1 Tax=Callorhinchus milii TaxID=7868 RepID=V9KG16_CALMI|nr:far upstream element-binding protein 2 isoform X2 [Callorhinchus milii]